MNAYTDFENLNQAEQQVVRDLAHSCDGPINDFVLIARAVEMARFETDRSPSDIANALFVALGLK